MMSFPLIGRAYDTEVSRVGIHLAAGAALLLALGLAAAGVGDRDGALSDWQALGLGIVQGLTELLPISSSGHLILVPWLGGWRFLETHDDFNQTFDVALHLGTLVAVVGYFREEIVRLSSAWIGTLRRRRIGSPDERVAWFVVVATIPAAAVGALGEAFIADRLGEPWQIAIFLSVFGVVLWLADRRPRDRRMSDLGLGTALAVGLAQTLSLAPGVSRSGITISAARALRIDRDSAARFSFLLLVPITFGAVAFAGVKDVLFGELPPGSAGPFVVGMIASAGSGLVAISAMLGYVRRHDYSVFVVYRLIAALVVALLIATGAREATF
jgi:undecaprenyl-diphosphatase